MSAIPTAAPDCDPPPNRIRGPRRIDCRPAPATPTSTCSAPSAAIRWTRAATTRRTSRSSTTTARVMQAVGIERGVLVQPSVYGTDNRATLDALREGGARVSRVAVPGADVDRGRAASGCTRSACAACGSTSSTRRCSASKTRSSILRRMRHRRWHLQLHIDLGRGPDALDALGDAPEVPVVVDHIGSWRPPHAATRCSTRAREPARCWVKLSAPYRVSAQPSPPRRSRPAGTMRSPTRTPSALLWGSDWPHTELHARNAERGRRWPTCCMRGFRTKRCGAQSASTNPARLYGFAEAT